MLHFTKLDLPVGSVQSTLLVKGPRSEESPFAGVHAVLYVFTALKAHSFAPPFDIRTRFFAPTVSDWSPQWHSHSPQWILFSSSP